MKYSKDTTVYKYTICDGNLLTDECGFEEKEDGNLFFEGTLQDLGESLSYGDFFQTDIKAMIKQLEKDKTQFVLLDGRYGDSISVNIN